MIGEDLGRLFEAGFNMGLLQYIARHPQEIVSAHTRAYDDRLGRYDTHAVVARFVERQGILDALNRDLARRTGIFFLFKGFLSGYHFTTEYVRAVRGSHTREPVRVLYLQCSFAGENSFDVLPQDEWGEARDWVEQLDLPADVSPDALFDRYRATGEFFKADTLMLVRHRRRHRILALDASVFSVRSMEDARDLTQPETLYDLLQADVNYIGAKSFFSTLSIDTGPDRGLTFSAGLDRYFTAFLRDDKESAKLIQAASYARSFYGFLTEQGILPEDDETLINVVGQTDRSVNGMTLRPDRFALLDTCARIYKRYRQDNKERNEEIAEARERVLRVIEKNAARSFEDGRPFIEDLRALGQERTKRLATHTETLTGFMNSVDTVPDDILAHHAISVDELEGYGLEGGPTLRNVHAALVMRALGGHRRYLFLTGNPGIGKTTAVSAYLKAHIDEGFLLFYASPRKQVNVDIINKFKVKGTDRYCDDRFLGLTSNADLVRDNGGVATVQYMSRSRGGPFEAGGVAFLDEATVDERAGERRRKGAPRIRRETNEGLRDTQRAPVGVLRSMCQAIPAVIDRHVSTAVVAAVSVQALKQRHGGADTLDNFETIFSGAYNKATGTVDAAKMGAIRARIKNIFIMIDEITGDDGGFEFLRRIVEILSKYHLEEHGFNLKIIVADASIVDADVIAAHLDLRATDPEPDKVYVRKVASGDSPALSPLTQQMFGYDDADDAVLINTNSYPAASLRLGYKVSLEKVVIERDMPPQEVKALLRTGKALESYTDSVLVQDICGLLETMPTGEDQCIVYVQNKDRLTGIIAGVTAQQERLGRAFEKGESYLEIHASISDEDRALIDRRKETAAVVFVTSSASRGLSFERARHILVDVPRFQIEANLMEIVQVIYRGRGDDRIDRTAKEITFYISDQVIWLSDEEDTPARVRESALYTLNLLILLKAAVMTRIAGAGEIRDDRIGVIPIGGKSVSAAGQVYHDQMGAFLNALSREIRLRPGDAALKAVHAAADAILGQADIEVSRQPGVHPYLTLLEESTPERLLDLLDRGGKGFLAYDPLQEAHVAGGLLIVPTHDAPIDVTHRFSLAEVIKTHITPDLRKNLYSILGNRGQYTPNTHGGVKLFLDLIDQLESAASSQELRQSGTRLHAYYAIPLTAFIAREVYQTYCHSRKGKDREGDLPFKEVLHHALRARYPVETVLPIGDRYGAFPYLTFTSTDLESLRLRPYERGYLLMSAEMNVLNMLLAEE